MSDQNDEDLLPRMIDYFRVECLDEIERLTAENKKLLAVYEAARETRRPPYSSSQLLRLDDALAALKEQSSDE